MKEYKQLMELVEGHDDVPVALYIAKNSTNIDWKNSLPEEVLYIPEKWFDSIGSSFIRKLGEKYYGTVRLSEYLLEDLKSYLSKKCTETEDEKLRVCAQEIIKFISKWEKLSDTHYIAFEGP